MASRIDASAGRAPAKPRQVGFDRFLIDRADEVIQDLVASFSARRPTATLTAAVAGLYVFALFHVAFAAMLPFYHHAIGVVIGESTSPMRAKLDALATNIVVGGMSYHLLLTVAYVLLSFLVRAARLWTRVAGTIVLAVNFAVALNGLGTPTVAPVFAVLQWITLAFTTAIGALLWSTALGRP
jgi:hypothetical protein